MSVRLVGMALVMATLLTMLGATVSAEEEKRDLWVYEGGWYKRIEGKKWVEVNPDTYGPRGGGYSSIEVTRTRAYVEILDEKRDIVVRLYDNMEEHKKERGPFQMGYKGRWKR